MKASNQLINNSLVISSLCLLLSGVSAQSVSDEQECEATVDMADSLDFHRMHMECNKDKKISRGVKVIETKKETKVQEKASQENDQSVAKTTPAFDETLEVTEPFSLTGGPVSAQLGLFKQMAQRCPNGWEKHQELVRPADQGFYLSYRFSCL